jgi:ribonucleoside-diphosphate reductase alpha chain
MLGIRYGSRESIELAREIMQRIATVTWHASIELAKEKGAFPFYHADYLRGAFVLQLDETLRRDIEHHHIRNSHHNTIAPTGTISLLANNISNGIEPIFNASYTRRVRMPDDEMKTFNVQDYAYRHWQSLHSTEEKPPAFVDVTELTPEAHLQIQAAMQPYIDNAISKTINIPRDFPFEKLASVYTQAYELGLKGCTVFRPNPVTGTILEEPTPIECCKE